MAKSNDKSQPRWFRSDRISFSESEPEIDAENGIIKGVSVCRVGEAKSYGVHLDQSFIEDVARLGNEYSEGLKCRFGHPNECSSALGTYLGRLKNFRVDGENARADLYLDKVAGKSPNGDLYAYVLELSQSNPDMFGTSIVFMPGKTYAKDKKGNTIEVDDPEWEDWDTENWDGKYYQRIEKLLACDCVDEPAANESLFSAQMNPKAFAVQATQLLDDNPWVIEMLNKNPEVVEGFLKRYEDYKMKQKKSIPFSEKAKRALKKLGLIKSFSDVDTTDGIKIRISNGEDSDPAPGDTVNVIEEDGSVGEPAGDGNHVINGGEYDGWVLVVAGGQIEEVIEPEEEEEGEEMSTKAQSSKYKLELEQLKKQLAKGAKEQEAAKAKIKKLESQVVDEHTFVDPEIDVIIDDTGKLKKSWEADANKLPI